jgi:AcrR family transcriptional regulator
MSAKDRIENAALDLFVRLGVDVATTKEIAAAASVSEGAIYRHYPSKEALATGLFMGVHRRLSAVVFEAAAEAPDIRGKAAAVVEAYCKVADENWTLFSFHMRNIHRSPWWKAY